MILRSSRPIQTGDSESVHVHKACRLLQKKHGRSLVQKGEGGDQKLVIRFIWPKRTSGGEWVLTNETEDSSPCV